MITQRVSVLALALATLVLVSASSASAQLDLAAPTYHQVHLLTGDGVHDGTESRVYVRIYSADRGAWSSWQNVDGLAAGSATPLLFQTAPNFTNITRVQVWEGDDDGVRVSVRVRSSNGTTLEGTQRRVWIKNGSGYFDLAEVQAYECDGPPTVCSCDVGPDCFGLWLTGICDQDSWECFDYSADAGGGQFCVCNQ
jgi:hypothetical protein